MASKVVILALVLVAFVGVAAAVDTPVPTSSATATVTAVAEAPANDDIIGNTDGNDAAGAPQAGGAGEVAPGPLGSGSAEGPSNGKSAGATLQASAIIGAAAIAGYFVV